MGGSALKHIGVQRLNAQDYFAIVANIRAQFEQLFGQVPSLIQAYASKLDFGDADLLVLPEQLPADWRDTLAQAMHSQGYVRNGDVTSMEIQNFQVDFISTTQQHLQWALTYFSFNDLGNLMGRIAHKMGFKYGHAGLVYVLRNPQNPDQVVREINLEATPPDVFDFLGYDHGRWQQGFNTLEDVFVYAASTPFFNADIYLLHNRNHVSRIRDAKRKTYTEFLKWCDAHQDTLRQYPWEQGADKTPYLQQAFKRWPAFEQEYNQALEQTHQRNSLQTVWNGTLVSQWTGLTGKELGAFLTAAKEHPEFETQVMTDARGFAMRLMGRAQS